MPKTETVVAIGGLAALAYLAYASGQKKDDDGQGGGGGFGLNLDLSNLLGGLGGGGQAPVINLPPINWNLPFNLPVLSPGGGQSGEGGGVPPLELPNIPGITGPSQGGGSEEDCGPGG